LHISGLASEKSLSESRIREVGLNDAGTGGVIEEDFDALRKAGLNHAAFGEIITALGVNIALGQELAAPHTSSGPLSGGQGQV
jgi:hypothetical protein